MPNNFPARPLVVIPTYNERENIVLLIPEILNSDDRLHVLVVDDGSPDDTAGEVLRLKERNWLSGCFLNRVLQSGAWDRPMLMVLDGGFPESMTS